MAQSTGRMVDTLLPVTFSLGGQSLDLTIPQDVPITELLPGVLDAFGRLEATSSTQGFQVLTSHGVQLDMSRTLPGQGVVPGAHLSIESADAVLSARRYDDLVEAVGDAMTASSAQWSDRDRVFFSSYAAAVLFAVSGILLMVNSINPWLVVAVGTVGAMLVTLCAALVGRQSSVPEAAIPLSVCSPIVAGAAAFSITPGAWSGLPLVIGGLAILGASPSILALPRRLWALVSGPLVFGAALVVTGGMVVAFDVSPQRSATVVLTCVVILTLIAPWVSLARLSHGIALDPDDPHVDKNEVQDQVERGALAVVSMKIAAACAMFVLLPLVATTALGIVLCALVSLTLMLSTRSMYSRTEVAIGIVTGMLLALGAGLMTVIYSPDSSLPLLMGACVVAGIVLTVNVVSVKVRPAVTRVADAAAVLLLLAILPVTVVILGVV